MLKIKDSVDLKHLENFGLKPKYDENTGEINAYVKVKTKELEGLKIIQISRRIRIYKRALEWRINKYDSYFDEDTLYDLIKADLVEKV